MMKVTPVRQKIIRHIFTRVFTQSSEIQDEKAIVLEWSEIDLACSRN